ncbi:hypothetical protein [Streptomyces sp. F001]|uniref:hypothetical protein n=1 Tax=Streptomyces sp. F001 TaxID=1510026 RepID=UPI001F0F2843|nr:hypothetical protein [Streptomyces sp. F001]
MPLQGASGAAAPFSPRLGDLARDTSKDGDIGVVVALPGEGRNTYHLVPPGGGDKWSAPNDGKTLAPVQPQVTHVTPQKRDVTYDARAEHGILPVTVHYDDGGAAQCLLVFNPSQLELYYYQVGRIIELRDTARGGKV